MHHQHLRISVMSCLLSAIALCVGVPSPSPDDCWLESSSAGGGPVIQKNTEEND